MDANAMKNLFIYLGKIPPQTDELNRDLWERKDYNTMLTIFLGTTITFLGILPSSHFWTISFSIAMVSISSFDKLTERGSFTLTFPLIETGYSWTSSIRKAGLNAG